MVKTVVQKISFDKIDTWTDTEIDTWKLWFYYTPPPPCELCYRVLKNWKKEIQPCWYSWHSKSKWPTTCDEPLHKFHSTAETLLSIMPSSTDSHCIMVHAQYSNRCQLNELRMKKLLEFKLIKYFTYPLFSTAFCAYSTWNTLPSGEKCEADKSYWKPKTEQA